MGGFLRKTYALGLFLFSLVLAAWAYHPGLLGTFIYDDAPNIIENPAIPIAHLDLANIKNAAFSKDAGPLYRPISMASFALNYYFTRFDPYYYKLTNLCLHLINGAGLFILTSLLLGYYRRHIQNDLSEAQCTWISAVVAGAWLLHPFNLTGVLYVVQRMTSLSAMFCIYGLALFFWGRIRLLEGGTGKPAILAALLLLTPLATFSKETGALLPLFMFVAEFTLFDFRTHSQSSRLWLIAFYAVSVAAPAMLALTYMLIHPGWIMGGYQIRSFDLVQRMMTEARVLWFYLKQIVLPDISAMGLFHDDFPTSLTLIRPPTTIPALLGILLLPTLAIFFRKSAPLLAFGILFYFAGQALESTIFPLMLVFEHRNYLPMFGILLAAFYYLLHPSFPKMQIARQALALLVITVFAFDTHSRAMEWSNPYDFYKWEVLHHPDSVTANTEMGDVFAAIRTNDPAALQRNAQTAAMFYQRAVALDNNSTIGLFGLVTLGARGVVKPDPSWMPALANRLANAPYANDIDRHLMLLVSCELYGSCKLTRPEFDILINAALSNPGCTGSNRALVYAAQSYYLIDVAKDYEGGLTALQNMADVPADHLTRLQNRLTLAKYLIAMNRFKEADQQLAMTEQMDTVHLFQQEIQSYRKQIPNHH